jgi:hypothetical protein
MISKALKNNTKMFRMLFCSLGVDEYVVNKDYDKLIKLWHKHRIHEVHEVGWSIGKTERHDQIFIQAISGREGCLWNIARSNLDLMIAGAEVNLGEDFGSN